MRPTAGFLSLAHVLMHFRSENSDWVPDVTIYRDWTKVEVSANPVQPSGLSSLGILPDRTAIFAEDYTSAQTHNPHSKRRFDLALALFLLPFIGAVIALFIPILLVAQGRPIFYRATRVYAPGRTFVQIKLRTMLDDEHDMGATGAHKQWRITPIGRFLRRTRIDELPQLFNIIHGDMSFVGPRPPKTEYVERCPEAFAQILRCRPGVTGLATLIYHRHEDKLLANCSSQEMTDRIYYERCLPTKFRIEQIYLRHRSIWLDLWIIWRTIKIVIFRRDERPRRVNREWLRFKRVARVTDTPKI